MAGFWATHWIDRGPTGILAGCRILSSSAPVGRFKPETWQDSGTLLHRVPPASWAPHCKLNLTSTRTGVSLSLAKKKKFYFLLLSGKGLSCLLKQAQKLDIKQIVQSTIGMR